MCAYTNDLFWTGIILIEKYLVMIHIACIQYNSCLLTASMVSVIILAPSFTVSVIVTGLSGIQCCDALKWPVVFLCFCWPVAPSTPLPISTCGCLSWPGTRCTRRVSATCSLTWNWPSSVIRSKLSFSPLSRWACHFIAILDVLLNVLTAFWCIECLVFSQTVLLNHFLCYIFAVLRFILCKIEKWPVLSVNI